MSRRPHSSETRSRTLGDYSIGGDSRTCTVSTDSVGQPRKKKFASPRCYCGSYTSQAHCKYFYWLDTLVEENIEEESSGRNTIFMGNRLKELEKKVMELEMELKIKLKNDVRGIQDNKCLRFAIVGLISILLVLAIKGMF
ncbi:hypothetical protein PIB30_062109 [Stylosanthes scabra]|uniref:Zinc finger GRF-type domain-containing protein n=1 Tax=Stylosanthes scabra TaxID=79078 RepID=A0ABU6TMQ2_9FABA|nr:hypothetical protein [Stylosanthes scabra]